MVNMLVSQDKNVLLRIVVKLVEGGSMVVAVAVAVTSDT